MTVKELVRALPPHVRVSAYDFALLPMSNAESRGTDAYGIFSSAEAAIKIHTGLVSKALAVDTLLHEILHAIFWAYHIKETDCEERTVSILGTAWAQIYRDNPWLLAWIARGLGHA